MKKNKLSKLLLTAAALLVVATSGFTIPKGPCDKDRDVCCEKPAPGPFAFSYPKDLSLACPSNFYVKGEFLLMQVKEEGLEYAMSQKTVAAGAGDSNIFPITDGDIQGYSTGSHNWDWTCGVRAGIGFYLNHDAWNIDATWTYLRINNDSGKTASGGVLLPFFLVPGIATTGQENVSSSAYPTSQSAFFK